jgi:DNA primase
MDVRPSHGAAERACLEVAAGVYHRRLLGTARARAYLAERGVDLATARRCRVGYATGRELVPALRAAGLPLRAAERTGLLRDGRETLAGRVVVPALRRNRAVWMVGRSLRPHPLRYHGLLGTKPLLGWDDALAAARRGDCVVVVEGPFDWLPLVAWGVPAVTPVGTYASPAVLRQLARLARAAPLCVAFDADEAGVTACFELQDRLDALGCRTEPVWLPRVRGRCAQDVGDLATVPGGRELFVGALERATTRAAAR